MSGKTLHGAYRVGGETRRVDLRLDGEKLLGTVDGEAVSAEAVPAGPGEIALRVNGRRVLAVVARRQGTWLVSVDGSAYEVRRLTEGEAESEGVLVRAEPFATSPMAGVLVKVHAPAGASVPKGAPLFAVEAMKMEYVVSADRDVVVLEVRRKAGDRVALGEVIVAFRDGAA